MAITKKDIIEIGDNRSRSIDQSDSLRKKIEFFNKRHEQQQQQPNSPNFESDPSRYITIRRGSVESKKRQLLSEKNNSTAVITPTDQYLDSVFIGDENKCRRNKFDGGSVVRMSSSLTDMSENMKRNDNHSSLNSQLPQQTRSSLNNLSMVGKTDPIAITDKLFEKFCMNVNEDIMNNGSLMLNDDKFVANNSNCYKINSKLLTDFLEAHDNDQMSVTDPILVQQRLDKGIRTNLYSLRHAVGFLCYI